MRALFLLPIVLALFDEEPNANETTAADGQPGADGDGSGADTPNDNEGGPSADADAPAADADAPELKHTKACATKDGADCNCNAAEKAKKAAEKAAAKAAAQADPPAPVAAPSNDRYIVETTTVFELLGSTVTYREGQIVRAGTREYDIARDFDVPLRPLAPIVR